MQRAGVIRIQDGDGGAGRRKIYAGINPLAGNHDKNVTVPENHDKNVTETMTELSRTNNVFNKKENSKPPISPKEKTPMPAALMQRVETYTGEDTELLERFMEFAEKRKARKKPINTDRTLTLLLSKLNELSGGNRKMKLALIDKAILNDWLSFFPLHEDDVRPAPPPDGRSVDAPPEVARW